MNDERWGGRRSITHHVSRLTRHETRNRETETRNRRWLVLVLLSGLLVAALPTDGLHPTPWSVDFIGSQSVLNGHPLPVGAVVRAYDSSGTLAGQTSVALAGWYLVPVYQDDPATGVDEGAQPGETIVFTVNDHPAVAMGPDPPVWGEAGTRVHVELWASTLAGDFDGDCAVGVTDVLRQSAAMGATRGQPGYYPPFDRDGDGDIDGDDLRQTIERWHTHCP